MRYLFIISGLMALTVVFSACQTARTESVVVKSPTPSNTAPAHPDDGAPRISLADAKAAFDARTAVFIDTRPAETYEQEHIKGAINITLTDDAAKYNKIPKGKKIIVYCS
jgi:3-mercaptopyruvate sulfurtransferase SseA